MAFIIKLAEKTIEINNIYPESKEFCKDYLVDNMEPEFSINITPEDIELEQTYSLETGYSLPYLETLTILRKISDILPLYQRILMHGAAISYHDEAYLFTAPSGTGKSTHIRLWKKYLGNDVKIVNGDKPFISLDHSTPIIYGTPWAGKERWQRNCREALKGICFLQRGTTNCIRKITPEECLSLLFHQVYIPNDPLSAGFTLELLDALLKSVPVYLLQCDMSEDAVRCSFEALTGLSYPN